MMIRTQSTGWTASRSSWLGTRMSGGLVTSAPPSRALCANIVDETLYGERFRLHNLSPQEASRKKKKRKGRGYSAGQGGSCGFGMRGQKSRSGRSVRPGFEGGQTPLYRRLPKLRGIAGGMPAGRTRFVTINVGTLEQRFDEGDVVDLATLKERGIINATGKERKLPLKILGEGLIQKAIEIKAAEFSSTAKQKIEEAGGTPTVVPLKPKWTQELHEQRVADGLIVPKKTKRYYYLQKLAAEKAAAEKAAESTKP